MTPSQKEFYKRIIQDSVTKAVKSQGSQVALAKKAELTQGAIGKYVRGEAMPTGVTARKLSEATGGEQPPSDFAPHIFQ